MYIDLDNFEQLSDFVGKNQNFDKSTGQKTKGKEKAIAQNVIKLPKTSINLDYDSDFDFNFEEVRKANLTDIGFELRDVHNSIGSSSTAPHLNDVPRELHKSSIPFEILQVEWSVDSIFLTASSSHQMFDRLFSRSSSESDVPDIPKAFAQYVAAKKVNKNSDNRTSE